MTLNVFFKALRCVGTQQDIYKTHIGNETKKVATIHKERYCFIYIVE